MYEATKPVIRVLIFVVGVYILRLPVIYGQSLLGVEPDGELPKHVLLGDYLSMPCMHNFGRLQAFYKFPANRFP